MTELSDKDVSSLFDNINKVQSESEKDDKEKEDKKLERPLSKREKKILEHAFKRDEGEYDS